MTRLSCFPVSHQITYQTSNFTKAMFALKLVFFPTSLIALIWYVVRTRKYRDEVLLFDK